jgi:hypothetical protein
MLFFVNKKSSLGKPERNQSQLHSAIMLNFISTCFIEMRQKNVKVKCDFLASKFFDFTHESYVIF